MSYVYHGNCSNSQRLLLRVIRTANRTAYKTMIDI